MRRRRRREHRRPVQSFARRRHDGVRHFDRGGGCRGLRQRASRLHPEAPWPAPGPTGGPVGPLPQLYGNRRWLRVPRPPTRRWHPREQPATPVSLPCCCSSAEAAESAASGRRDSLGVTSGGLGDLACAVLPLDPHPFPPVQLAGHLAGCPRDGVEPVHRDRQAVEAGGVGELAPGLCCRRARLLGAPAVLLGTGEGVRGDAGQRQGRRGRPAHERVVGQGRRQVVQPFPDPSGRFESGADRRQRGR